MSTYYPPYLLAWPAAALQLNYSMLRKRGQRCTYQSLRAAVEEQTSKRFLVS